MGGTAEASVTSAILGRRTRLVLGQRLGSRANQILSPRAGARTNTWRAVAAASAIGDLAVARWLQRTGRFALGPRLALDALDLALWSAAAPDEFEAQQGAVIPGIPLAVEAGARLGLAGLAVPAVNGAVRVAVGRAKGRDPRVEQLLWQVAGAVGGMGLAAYGRRQRRRELARHRRELEPRLEAAELAGMAELAVGGDPVLDTVQRATTLVRLLGGAGPSGGGAETKWKLDFADRVRARHVYLGDLVLRWQTVRNTDPDLRRTVRATLADALGTTILDPQMADALWAALEALDPRGEVRLAESPVAVDARREVAVRVTVDGRAPRDFVLRSDTPAPRLSFDAVPGAFLWSALWLCVPMSRSREGVRWWAAVPLAGGAVAASVAAHRAGRSPGARRRAVAGSFALTLVATAAQTCSMRSSHAEDGSQRVPFGMALQGFELVGACAGEDVSPAVLGAGGAVVGLVSWWLTPAPKRARTHLAEMVWPIATGLAASSWPLSIQEDAERLATAVRADDDAAIEAASQRGRRRVVALLTASMDEAEGSLGTATLTPTERAEVERRLGLARERLETVSRAARERAVPVLAGGGRCR
jgi:hypothetical protein